MQGSSGLRVSGPGCEGDEGFRVCFRGLGVQGLRARGFRGLGLGFRV